MAKKIKLTAEDKRSMRRQALRQEANRLGIRPEQLDAELCTWESTFHLAVDVMAKQSARFGVRCYPDSKVEANRKIIAEAARDFAPPVPLDCPVRLWMRFIDPHTQEMGLLGDYWRPATPDWDNRGKQVSDALEEAGFYVNDSLAVDAAVYKTFGHADEAGVIVHIKGLQAQLGAVLPPELDIRAALR